MKPILRHALTCWCIGIVILITQSVISPLTLESITAILQTPESKRYGKLTLLLILYFTTTIGCSIFNSIATIVREKMVGIKVNAWSAASLKRVLATSNEYLRSHDPERVVGQISADTETCVGHHAALLFDAPPALLGLFLTFTMMFYGSSGWLSSLGFSSQKGNVTLALLVVALAPFQLLFLLYNKRYALCENERREVAGRETLNSTESLRGITDIRSANAFPFIFRRIDDMGNAFYAVRIKISTLLTVFGNIGGLVWGFTQVALLSISAWLIFRHTVGFSYADYVGFSVLCSMFNTHVVQTVQIVISWQSAQQARLRMNEIDSLPDVFGPNAGRMPIFRDHGISFNKVAFATPQGAPILHEIDLAVKSGEHVALVGPSGCGKSTLLKLAMRHLTPTSGEILFGGEQIDQVNFAQLAQQVAYVSQSPFIFHGTLRENIMVGRDLKISDEQLLQILVDVGLDDDLKLKNADPTKVLESEIQSEGRDLSGGQKAKIALARALVAKPNVLLLDEVTSALDEISQDKVTRLLNEKCREKTVILISHRLPAVRDMDRLVVMQSGRIVQTGTYAELTVQAGLFATLVARETGHTFDNGMPTLDFGNTPSGNVQTLSLSPIFANLDSQALTQLAQTTNTRSLGPGETLFHKGDNGSDMYVIKSGSVIICGRTLGAGASFGEIALFGGTVRTVDVSSCEGAELLSLNRESVFAVCRNHPDISLRILKGLAMIASRETVR